MTAKRVRAGKDSAEPGDVSYSWAVYYKHGEEMSEVGACGMCFDRTPGDGKGLTNARVHVADALAQVAAKQPGAEVFATITVGTWRTVDGHPREVEWVDDTDDQQWHADLTADGSITWEDPA